MKKLPLWIFGIAAITAGWASGSASQLGAAHAAPLHTTTSYLPAISTHQPLPIIPLGLAGSSFALAPAVSASAATGTELLQRALAPTKTTPSSSAEAGENTSSGHESRRPIDLTMLTDAVTTGSEDPAPQQADAAGHDAQSDQAAIDDSAAAPVSTLFNRESGLRGFMVQSWVNQQWGLQGGLAFVDNWLREHNNDLENNVAVGMGLLLAF